jgi:hypothetical protein
MRAQTRVQVKLRVKLKRKAPLKLQRFFSPDKHASTQTATTMAAAAQI